MAEQHFQQYVDYMREVESLDLFMLPDSQQIEESYRKAVVEHDLPVVTAFDAVFTNSAGAFFDFLLPGPKEEGFDWMHALGMEEARIAPSDVFDDIGTFEASRILGETMLHSSRSLTTDLFEVMDGPTGILQSILEQRSLEGFIDDVNERFNRGESHASPIILDLDGNGISTLGLEAGVQFDHNGDGFAQATGWVGPEDALLAMDLTGNEEIETGSELFGNASEIEEGVTAMNGFEALAIHDTNGNGRIDPGDEAWDDLRLWQDANGNGVVDEGELLTLDEVGIGSIDLGYSDSTYVDEHGNEHRQIGRFEWADGREGEATDVWFIQDTAHTETRERLDVPEDIATLPDLKGYGEVHDLHRARMPRKGRPSSPKALRRRGPGGWPVEREHHHTRLIDNAA